MCPSCRHGCNGNAVPDGAAEPPGIIDVGQWIRPESAALREELMAFLASGKKAFAEVCTAQGVGCLAAQYGPQLGLPGSASCWFAGTSALLLGAHALRRSRQARRQAGRQAGRQDRRAIPALAGPGMVRTH